MFQFKSVKKQVKFKARFSAICCQELQHENDKFFYHIDHKKQHGKMLKGITSYVKNRLSSEPVINLY